MSLETIKTLERRIRRFVRREKYQSADLMPDEKFYWHVSHVFNSVLGDGCVSITMPPDKSDSVLIGHEATQLKLRLTSAPSARQTVLEQRDGIEWTRLGKYKDRQIAILNGLKITVAGMLRYTSDITNAEQCQRKKWESLDQNGKPTPKLLNLGDQWTTTLHRSGWGYALDPLECLHDKNGVIFDGFLEATFCWKDTGKEYLKPWVGVMHNPPETPKWINGGTSTNKYMMKTERWINSRKNCKGIFVLSEYHKKSLERKLRVPVSVIRHPTETPEQKFTMSGFQANPAPKLVQVGYWLRNPNSLYQVKTTQLSKARLDVGHPWEEKSRQHLPADNLDLDSVEVIPRLDNDEYDELLATNIVFLDLLDSSANNAIIECIVRNTPVLVNRIAPVVEYLGHQYPFYFRTLEEASQKADDMDLIRQTHEYLSRMSKQQYSQEAFLESVVQSEVYQSLLPSTLDDFVLLAHARSGSTTLHHILNAHDDIRMAYEPFNPKREKWIQHNYHGQVTDDASLIQSLNEIYNYHNGAKHLIYQLSDHQNEILLGRDCRRIFLNRQNLLQTTVSGMIAEQTKKWAGNRNEILTAWLEPLDLKEVGNRVNWLKKSISRYRRLMVDKGLEFLEVKYEDLYGPNLSLQQKLVKVDQIFHYLGAQAPSASARQRILEVLSPDANKINSTSTYQRIPNIEAIEKTFGNDATGFLFTESSRTNCIAAEAA